MDGFIATNPSMDALPAIWSWQPPRSHGTYQHEVITSRSRQFLMMGTWLPKTCSATNRREIKNTKVTSSWFFWSTLNYVARSTTHQIVLYSIWYRHTCRWPSSAQVLSQPVHQTATYTVWRYQMLYDTILTAWWWAQQCLKHVEAYNKLTIKKRFCALS